MLPAKDLSLRIIAKGGIVAEGQYCESDWNDLDNCHTERAYFSISEVLYMQVEGGGIDMVAEL